MALFETVRVYARRVQNGRIGESFAEGLTVSNARTLKGELRAVISRGYFFVISVSVNCAARKERMRFAHAGQLMHGVSVPGIWHVQLRLNESPI